MVLFIMIVTIGNQDVSRSCEEALCFNDINRCLYFAERINQQPENPDITAYCQPINADTESRWYK